MTHSRRRASRNRAFEPVGGGTDAGASEMARITVVYWRDIPAQVLAGTGRKAAKVVLSERFEPKVETE